MADKIEVGTIESLVISDTTNSPVTKNVDPINAAFEIV